MNVTRQSKLTGITRTVDIDVTPEQLAHIERPDRTELIQHICPALSPSDREFLLTGITDDEWESMWQEDEQC